MLYSVLSKTLGEGWFEHLIGGLARTGRLIQLTSYLGYSLAVLIKTIS